VERPIDRRRAATRREILDAAWALCREHGLTGLSLRDLAARVGMRAPSLYSYFASKDAIYDAMFADGQLEFGRRLADAAIHEGTPRDRLRAGMAVFARFCTEDPVRYQLLFQRVVPGFEPSPESYALAVEHVELLAAALRDAGVTDPRQVDLWTAVFSGLTSQQITNDPGGDRWLRLVDEAVDLLCDHAEIPPARPSRRTR
jgi:AcrR family transcriptional regulator